MTEENEKFPSNSIKKRSQKPAPMRENKPVPLGSIEEGTKNLKKMTMGTAKVKKPSFTSKLKDTFFGDDANNVASYILWDVLIPALKDTIQDAVTKGIERMLFGGSRGSNSRVSSSGKSIVSYGNYYRGSRSPAQRPDKLVRAPGYNRRVDNVVFDYEEAAGEALELMHDLLEEYGQVTVADFYEIVGLPNYSEFTDNSVGWTNLTRVRIVPSRDGWQMIMPNPQPL